ncbi:hypothetical protein H2200_001660 [Cladophialophora chaetospira]|uniref:C3H1-type domain-containing protein n=1 Tax=Cladophialophora chaetospira TaxID=386627 RepID=A0AA38XLK4_9EURO|nr:hypothetical protein H2200_001660 [Cladophialophora chaetospira]
MSSQPFSFPPPPPPPPKRATEGTSQQNPNAVYSNGRGAFRGSEGYRGSSRGGRGAYGDHRSGAPGRPMNFGSSHGQNYSQRPPFDGPARRGFSNAPQKRDFKTAFSPNERHHRPRPTAPPPVPDFNASLQHLLSPKPSTEQPPAQPSNYKPPASKKQEPKKNNLLGLTPAKFEHDSDPEDDVDEEQKLATQAAAPLGGHLFEYNGNPLMLRTREEILAWIAERKRKFPTEAKRLAAQKEFEEKKRKREDELKARLQAKREAEAKRSLDRAAKLKSQELERKAQQEKKRDTSNDSGPIDDAARARLKAEKLRKKALKAQQELERAEEALRLAQAKQQESSTVASIPEANQHPVPEPSQILPKPAPNIEEEETSSSGSSSGGSDSDSPTNSEAASDSDSAPEVTSAKDTTHGIVPFLRPPRKAREKPPKLCSHFAKYKSCKFGINCRYSHDLSQKSRKASGTQEHLERLEKEGVTSTTRNAKRKGLWQVMVEKEQEEERRRLLGAIITLGERGMLAEPAQKPDGLQ